MSPTALAVGLRALPFSAGTEPAAEAQELAEVVDRLRESLSRLEKERRAMVRVIPGLLDSGLDLGFRSSDGAGEQRYRCFLARELQSANVGLEELVLNLRTVLGKRFRLDFVNRARADLEVDRVDGAHSAVRRLA